MSLWLALVLIWGAAIVGFILGAVLTRAKRDEVCWHCGRHREGPT
jgi:hypothetical protein